MRYRVIGATDERVYLFKAGWFRRRRPGQLLHVAPFRELALALDAPQPPTPFRGVRVLELGGENLRLMRAFWEVMAQNNDQRSPVASHDR
jgi:hypothetical protein